jgi:hypothetical protein
MKELMRLLICPAVLLAFAAGCGREDSAGEKTEGAENRVKVCGFKDGHGVFVGEETRAALGLGTMEVTPKAVPRTIQATARVFAPGKASMVVETNTVAAISMGQRVLLADSVEGEVVTVERAPMPLTGTVELVIAFSRTSFDIGAHVRAKLEIEGGNTLPGVPESSLLYAATGDYVFVVNGQHFLRTPVKVAAKSEGWVAIADGLLEGDEVVTNGVDGLWCIELQATKGGYACCAVAKKE